MKAITILCSLLLSINLLGQKAPIKYGNVPEDDLRMTVYDQDKSAAAIVLADYGESAIVYNQTNGFEIEFERIRRIKIINKDGYEYANLIIPIYKRDNIDEKLTGLKAVTVNMEGNKMVETKLGNNGIFREAASENWDNIKLTLPNVKEGSVIDISYRIRSPYLFNFQDWEFQANIPVRWSEYVAHIPEYFEYQKFSQGYVPFKINEQSSQRKTITLSSKERSDISQTRSTTTSFDHQNIEYNERTYRWVAENVPAFNEEPYMTTISDFVSKMNFELALIQMPNQPIKTVMGTWENINKELLDATEFGGVVKRSNFLNKIVEETIGGKATDADKILSVYNFVKSNVQWDGNYRKYTDGNFKRVLESKRGNSAEINLMLVSMLQKAALKADPVVISTRNHGFVREQFPLSSQFNYVICAVELDGKILLLDATDRSLPAMMMPERCLNGNGLLISENNSRWIGLSPTVKTKTVQEATVEFTKEGKLNGKMQITRDGYDGQRMRLDFDSQGEESYIKSLVKKNDWTIHSSKFENLKKLDEPVKEIHDVSFNEENLLADIIYINPMFGGGISENPFKSEKREYPVDFGSGFEQTNIIKIKIPAGYIVEEMPKPIALALPEKGGKFFYSISNVDGVLSLTSIFSINKGMYSQSDYQHLKEFYAQAVSKHQEQLVLKKSSN